MRAFFAIVIILALIFGIALPRYLAPDDLSGCRAPGTSTRCAPADAVVAISGGDTLARADEAIALYKDGWAPKLIFSGAAGDIASPSNASTMRLYAVGKGVAVGDVIVDEKARSTSENAVNVAQIAREKGYGRLILVTSGYHQRRADLEFAKALGTGKTVVNHPLATDNQWSNWWWATPIGWWLSASEIIKIGAFYAGIG